MIPHCQWCVIRSLHADIFLTTLPRVSYVLHKKSRSQECLASGLAGMRVPQGASPARFAKTRTTFSNSDFLTKLSVSRQPAAFVRFQRFRSIFAHTVQISFRPSSGTYSATNSRHTAATLMHHRTSCAISFSSIPQSGRKCKAFAEFPAADMQRSFTNYLPRFREYCTIGICFPASGQIAYI